MEVRAVISILTEDEARIIMDYYLGYLETLYEFFPRPHSAEQYVEWLYSYEMQLSTIMIDGGQYISIRTSSFFNDFQNFKINQAISGIDHWTKFSFGDIFNKLGIDRDGLKSIIEIRNIQ